MFYSINTHQFLLGHLQHQAMLFSEILDPWPNKMDLGTVKYKRRALIKKLQPDTHQFQNTSNLGSRVWVSLNCWAVVQPWSSYNVCIQFWFLLGL